MKTEKTEEEIKQEKINWHQNKIKGGFAEEVCKSHFQYLDFDVTPSGIEHIAPQYTKYKNRIETKSNEVKKVLDKNPDLLVSNEEKAFLVEVKFRSGIKTPEDFYKLGDQLLFDYRYMLFRCNRLSNYEEKKDFIKELNTLPTGEMETELCENFIFYVVLPEPDHKYYSYVHIFIPKNYRTKENGRGWRNAKDALLNDKLNIDNFNIGYHEVVKPMLDELLNQENYTILSVSKKDAKEYNSSWNGEMQEIKTDKGVFIDNLIGNRYYGYIGQNWEKFINKKIHASVKFDKDQYWLRIENS